jgi:hypothetical protein
MIPKEFILRIFIVSILSLPAFGQFSGATPDEIRRQDGVMNSLVSTASSTTPLTPSYSTNASTELVLNFYTWLGITAWGTSPAGMTNVVTSTPASGKYTAYVYYQSLSSTGTGGGVSGTLGGSVSWVTATLPLILSSATTSRTAQIVQQASGSTSVTVNKPTSTAVGDFMLACLLYNPTSDVITPPSGWGVILLEKNGTGATTLACYARVATSADVSGSSYTFSQTTTGSLTAFTMGFTNVTYPDELLTSATASFAAGDVGKDICVAATPQSCGTIGQVISGTKLLGYGVWNTATKTSSIEYRYGTDNSTALQNAVNAATTNSNPGLNLQLPCGGMMFSTPLTIPAASGNNIPVVVWGCGAGDLMFEESSGNSKNLLAFGSELDYANSASASPAITIYTVGANVMYAVSFDFRDFTLWGGAGNNEDGGGYGTGTVGIESGNALPRTTFTNVEVGNFASDDVLIASNGTSSATGWLKIINSYFLMSGADGLYINGANGGVQNITLDTNTLDANAGCGLHIGGTPIWTMTLVGNSISRNSGSAEMCIDLGSGVSGFDVQTNYWETDAASSIPLVSNWSLLGPARWGPQTIIYGSGAGAFTGTYPTVSGTGACASIGTQLGTIPSSSGTWAGPYSGSAACTGTTGSSTFVISNLPTAQNGWNCGGSDITAPAVLRQQGNSTTQCTLGTSASVSTNDVVSFWVAPF